MTSFNSHEREKEKKERESRYYSQYDGGKEATAKPQAYLDLYARYFAELTEYELTILELGIFEGASLEYFAELFPKSRIIGVDINECSRKFSTDRIKVYQGSQDDAKLYDRIMQENGIKQFDIIIDDCSHIGSLTLDSFNILFPVLRPEGFYVIEDWGTGYFKQFPGGRLFNPANHLKTSRLLPKKYDKNFSGEYFKSHQYGIPGVIKQLVDEVGMGDINHDFGTGTHVFSKLKYLHVYLGIVFMQKR